MRNEKPEIVQAGDFWKFQKATKFYKLVITKIDYPSGTYGVELYEYK